MPQNNDDLINALLEQQQAGGAFAALRKRVEGTRPVAADIELPNESGNVDPRLQALLQGSGAVSDFESGLQSSNNPMRGSGAVSDFEGSALSKATGIGPNPNPNPFDKLQGQKVMEAGIPTGKGVIAQLAGRLAPAAYDAAAEINPQALERLAAQARPVFNSLKAAGQFAGDRTTGLFSDLSKRLAPKLGEQLAEYAPVGGEEIVNALRPTAPKVMSPIEKAYQRLLLQGGR